MKIFSDIFTINQEELPHLTTCQLKVGTSVQLDTIGRKVRYRLQTHFGGHWSWDKENKYVVTDSPPKSSMQTFLKKMWGDSEDDILPLLEDIEVFPNGKVSPQGVADFVASSLWYDFSQEINVVLRKYRLSNNPVYFIDRECNLYGWIVDGDPAVSVSISSTLKHKQDLKAYAATLDNIDKLKGLHVRDKTKPKHNNSMEITDIVGRLGDGNTRDRLLSYKPTAKIIALIKQAPDDEWVVRVGKNYDYIASALEIQILNADYNRFGIKNVNLQITPADRAKYIKSVVEIIRGSGLVNRSYSETTHSHLFLKANAIGFNRELRVGNGQIIKPTEMYNSLKKHGLYKPTTNKEIRIAFLNTSPEIPTETLGTRLLQELHKGLGYKLKKVEYKKVPNPSRRTLNDALEPIAKSKPDIIVGIMKKPRYDTDEKTLYDEFKELSFSRGLPSQVIQSETVKNLPSYVMKNIVLGILAKTGNVPYVLAEPIKYADIVVGLDVARQQKGKLPGTMNFPAMACFFLADGNFMRFNAENTQQEGEIIPEAILRKFFHGKEFAGKRIIIHRDGNLPASEKEALMKLGDEFGITFCFVEVIKSGTPRLFASESNNISAPPTGTIMKLSETEALLVSAKPVGKGTPLPIRIRTHDDFPLENALHSVLSLTLLHYGATQDTRLPVTVYYADKICSMIQKGLKPAMLDGNIPFWL